jgi:hypothetical protein
MKLFGISLKKEKSYGRNRKCDVKEEEVWGPDGPKKRGAKKKVIQGVYPASTFGPCS